MNKYIIFIIIVIISSCSHKDTINTLPKIKNGVLDLRNWDFEKDGPVPLDGNWRFFWKKLINPDKVFQNKDQKFFFKVPLSWNGQKVDDRELPGIGFATYHCKVLLPDKSTFWGLKFPTISSAFNFYVNGKKISTVGKVGKNKEEMVPEYRPHISIFKSESKELDFVFQVSNFFGKWGGLWYSLHFGSAKQIIKLREKKMRFDYFLFGIYVIMFFYHLSLFALRPKEKLTLYFGLFCLIIALRGMVQSEVFILSEIIKGLNYNLLVGLDYITLPLGICAFAMFLWTSFPKDYSKFLIMANLFLGGIFAIIILFTKPIIYQELLAPYQIIILINLIYLFFYFIIIIFIRQRNGAIPVLLGSIILGLTALNDILYSMHFVQTTYLITYGLLMFVFSQSYMISFRFSKAFKSVENLSGKLEEKNVKLNNLNQNLETIVEKRTEELESANEFLIKTKNELWGEMELAKKIQTVLLPIKPKIKGYEISAFMKTADEVGGDYYDIVNTADRNWIIIGDVSGHGVPAGLIMMMVQSCIRSHIENNPEIKPSNLLKIVNKTISHNIELLNEKKFMTITAIAIDDDGKATFSGRHEDILIYRSSNKKIEVIKTDGICISPWPLGKDNVNIEFNLDANDILMLYTDGITEAWKNDNSQKGLKQEENMYGSKKLIETFQEIAPTGTLDQIKEHLLNSLDGYIFDDDITLILLERVK